MRTHTAHCLETCHVHHYNPSSQTIENRCDVEGTEFINHYRRLLIEHIKITNKSIAMLSVDIQAAVFSAITQLIVT